MRRHCGFCRFSFVGSLLRDFQWCHWDHAQKEKPLIVLSPPCKNNYKRIMVDQFKKKNKINDNENKKNAQRERGEVLVANSGERKENERWGVKCWRNQAKKWNLKIAKRKIKKLLFENFK